MRQATLRSPGSIVTRRGVLQSGGWIDTGLVTAYAFDGVMGVTEITEGAVTQVPQSPGFSWKPVETQGFSLNSPYSPSSNQSIIHIIPYLSYLAKRRVFMVALPGPVSTCIFSLCFFQPSWDNQVDLAEALHIAACSVNLCGMTCHAPLIIRTYLSVFFKSFQYYRVYRFEFSEATVCASICAKLTCHFIRSMFPRSGIQNHSIGSCVWRWDIFSFAHVFQVWELWDNPQLNPIDPMIIIIFFPD